jgi:non-specific serine/threonine protein kinase
MEGTRPAYSSGECEIDLGLRELRMLGSPVPLGARAFEIIEILVGSAGELVSKNELMDRIWPGATVNDNALQVHISALRKALGPYRTMLRTESGRGYRLLGSWAVRQDGPAAPQLNVEATSRSVDAPTSNLPVNATRLIGRSSEIPRLQVLLSAYRVVTLSGPGGIGKTTLAIEVAHRVVEGFDGVWFIELGSLLDPHLVPSAVAGVLGLKLGGRTISSEAVARAIAARNELIVLDNCEHVIDSVAEFVETILRVCPRVTVLATSREVLRVDGEYSYRIPPLDLPPPDEVGAEYLRGHSAVELFITRTQALDFNFAPNDQDLAIIAAICRRLDGIPLAIEFAAARTATLGLREVALRIDDRFTLLTSGRRTALPRHQTLRATLDWSYELLPETEQRLLRRFGVFVGGFTMENAAIVAGSAGSDTSSVAEGIANLVSKSLVILTEPGRWEQLETIRAYALEQLAANGERAQVRRLHAEAMRSLFRRADAEVASGVSDEWRKKYEPEVGNLRSVLDWAFGRDGDAALGVTLASTATNCWIALSLLGECCDWAARAIAQLGPAAGTHDEIVLQCSLGLALTFSRGVTPEAQDALTRALALSEAAADTTSQLRAVFGLWLRDVRAANFRGSLAMAVRHEALAATIDDAVVAAVSNCLLGVPRFCLGEYAPAAINLERVRNLYPLAQRNSDAIRFGVDFLSVSRCYHAAALWALGFPERAAQAGREAIEEARAIDHPVSLCLVLGITTITVLVPIGDFGLAESCIDQVIDHAHRHSLPPYHAVGLCAKGSLMAARGDVAAANQLLEAGLAHMREVALYFYYPFFLSERAAALAVLGRVGDGLADIDAALRQAEASGALWCMERIFRIKGELLTRNDQTTESDAEQALLESLGWARRQEALSLELRAAMSLARFWRDRHRIDEARELLGGVYGKFAEGFETADLVAARDLLAQLT